jgi:hypothetical protein
LSSLWENAGLGRDGIQLVLWLFVARDRKQIAKEQSDRDDADRSGSPGEQPASENGMDAHADENHRQETPDRVRDLQFLFQSFFSIPQKWNCLSDDAYFNNLKMVLIAFCVAAFLAASVMAGLLEANFFSNQTDAHIPKKTTVKNSLKLIQYIVRFLS